MINLENFQEQCIEKTEKKSKNITKWENLRINQLKLGNCYKPKCKTFSNKCICPNCKNILNKMFVFDSSHNTVIPHEHFIFSCNTCEYEYAT